ncbi:tRNA (adenosine(37)-N6)-threonylcarbamoyltransferase complex transferase subunit TsaD [Candidatus Fermentibacteria bacterium]|nr:MAG: tRNA (adenosine(37)-N6)-threonylcarbamoyltransferase complex transferase subunit TsaD [Candidatus Fermentibacteria bacterium]
MRLLAVETSCDDSAAAVLDERGKPLAELVSTQTDHVSHGGVVPEIASRLHLAVLPGIVREVLDKAGISLKDIDAFAATSGPGLTGSLLVGLSWTKAAAFALKKPFLAINHLAAHLHIHWGSPVEFPAVALLVSGGHTMLFHMTSWSSCKLLGSTRDDAAGEAFDKTAKLMDMGFPGGRIIDEIAERGNSSAVELPSPLGNKRIPEFSFSGLKTAVRLQWEEGSSSREDMAASFRKTVCDILVSKTLYQASTLGAKSVLAAGGVSANSLLRRELSEKGSKRGLKVFLPEMNHTMDNAVMVGRAALSVLKTEPAFSSSLSVSTFPRWHGTELSPLSR